MIFKLDVLLVKTANIQNNSTKHFTQPLYRFIPFLFALLFLHRHKEKLLLNLMTNYYFILPNVNVLCQCQTFMKGTLTFTVLSMWSLWPPLFFFLDWKKYLYRSLLPQTEPTAEWNKPVLPSLWAARVTLGNVGNHRLNIKYWVVVRKKKYSGFHRWNVSSRGIKTLRGFFLFCF